MSLFTSIPERFTFAAESVLGCSVAAMPRQEWISLVQSDGSPTLLNDPPGPVKGVMHDAMMVAAAASGVCNPNPGFDIVRYDPTDAPHIYNIDHYKVVERLPQHEGFLMICKKAGVTPTAELEDKLAETVFIIKEEPQETPDHWSQELPHRIQIARHKGIEGS